MNTSSRNLSRSVFTIFILVLACSAAVAAPLADYRTRLENAQVDIKNMLYLLTQGESSEEVEDYLQETIERLRISLPANEKIQSAAGEVEAANGWLKVRLDQFEKELHEEERIELLNEISERIAASLPVRS